MKHKSQYREGKFEQPVAAFSLPGRFGIADEPVCMMALLRSILGDASLDTGSGFSSFGNRVYPTATGVYPCVECSRNYRFDYG